MLMGANLSLMPMGDLSCSGITGPKRCIFTLYTLFGKKAVHLFFHLSFMVLDKFCETFNECP